MELNWQRLREAGNRGAFYPAEEKNIIKFFDLFSQKTDKITGKKELLPLMPRAIVSPHAGYVYSGFTANVAHKTLANSKPSTIVVVGPSHRVFFRGVSAAFTEFYETPLGLLKTNKKLLEKLDRKYNFLFEETAHYHEHSTETQMPFIARYNPQATVIELIYGKTDENYLSEILNDVFIDAGTAVVISSDLSHFHPEQKANLLDEVCIRAFENQDVNLFDKGCEACGITGMKALVKTAQDYGWKSGVLDYRTSAGYSGDTTSVVGYMSGIVWEE